MWAKIRWCMVTLTLTLFAGCNLDEGQNFHLQLLEIAGAELPERFVLGETYEIPVLFRRDDSCTFFEGFDVTRDEPNTRNVVAIGSVLTDADCVTTEDEVEALLRFNVAFNEPYLFRFYTGNDADGEPVYIEYEVAVSN